MIAQPEAQERRRQGALDLVRIQIQIIREEPRQPHVEHEVRVGVAAQDIDQLRLALDAGDVQIQLLGPGLPDSFGLDGYDVAAVLVLQRDDQDLARTVLVHGYGFRCARVSVGDVPGSAFDGGVPVAQR